MTRLDPNAESCYNFKTIFLIVFARKPILKRKVICLESWLNFGCKYKKQKTKQKQVYIVQIMENVKQVLLDVAIDNSI